MKENYTISLKVFIFLISLAILHTLGRILGGLGLISDLFTVLGAYSVWKNVKTSEARQRIINKVDEVIDVEDLGELLSNKTKQLKDQVKKIKTPSDIPAFDLDALLGNDEEVEVVDLDKEVREGKREVLGYTPPTNFKGAATNLEAPDIAPPGYVDPLSVKELNNDSGIEEDDLYIKDEDLDEFLEQDGSGI